MLNGLESEPLLCDAARFGYVSRKRFLWSSRWNVSCRTMSERSGGVLSRSAWKLKCCTSAKPFVKSYLLLSVGAFSHSRLCVPAVAAQVVCLWSLAMDVMERLPSPPNQVLGIPFRIWFSNVFPELGHQSGPFVSSHLNEPFIAWRHSLGAATCVSRSWRVIWEWYLAH